MRFPPAEIADAVTLYFRAKGRHARLVWNEVMRCWQIEIELSGDDPRMKAYQAGVRNARPVEVVPLHHRPKGSTHLVAMDLDEIGASGITELLAQGDLLTGRGEFPDLLSAIRAQHERNEKHKADMFAKAFEAGMEATERNKRQILEGLGHSLPFVTVPNNVN